MAREETAETLNALMDEARRTEMEAVTLREKLKVAYACATELAKKVRIINPEGAISWVNCLMEKVVADQDVTSDDLFGYCKIVLDILDPDFGERFTHPAPESSILVGQNSKEDRCTKYLRGR